jgi:hypothetical protein
MFVGLFSDSPFGFGPLLSFWFDDDFSGVAISTLRSVI